MKVLLCLCACVATAVAHGVIGYPVAPFIYQSSYISPVPTITRPVGVYHTFPVAGGPYFSYNLIPNNVIFTGVPGTVSYIPLVPTAGKGKPDKKKPGDKTTTEKKEETTEEPAKEESESKTESTEETEDLAR